VNLDGERQANTQRTATGGGVRDPRVLERGNGVQGATGKRYRTEHGRRGREEAGYGKAKRRALARDRHGRKVPGCRNEPQ
jgi:hypothetical protein